MSVTAECPEYDKLKEELIGLGLYEDGMNIDDMIDLMAAIRNSEDSAIKEERLRESNKKVQACSSGDTGFKDVKGGMERRYKNVPERRLPWNLFPFPEQLSLEQRSRILAAYKEQLTLCQYRKAKSSTVFTEWSCIYKLPIKITTEYKSPSAHHTRSGRTLKTTPHYVDDDSDSECASVARKPRKKMRKLTNEEIISKSSLFKDIANVDLSLVANSSDNKIAQSAVVGESSSSFVPHIAASVEEFRSIDMPTPNTSPEYGNEDIIFNEENRGRKRAR